MELETYKPNKLCLNKSYYSIRYQLKKRKRNRVSAISQIKVKHIFKYFKHNYLPETNSRQSNVTLLHVGNSLYEIFIKGYIRVFLYKNLIIHLQKIFLT